MDAAELAFQLHGRALRMLAAEAGCHFQGLSVGARYSRKTGLLSTAKARRLRIIDEALGLIRHITDASPAAFLQDLSNDLKGLKADKADKKEPPVLGGDSYDKPAPNTNAKAKEVAKPVKGSDDVRCDDPAEEAEEAETRARASAKIAKTFPCESGPISVAKTNATMPAEEATRQLMMAERADSTMSDCFFDKAEGPNWLCALHASHREVPTVANCRPTKCFACAWLRSIVAGGDGG